MIENLPVKFIITIILGYQGPKFGRVIHVDLVSKLVNEDIVNHCGGISDQTPRKVETAQSRRAAPNGTLIFDVDVTDGGGDMHESVELRDPAGNVFSKRIGTKFLQEREFFGREGRRGFGLE